MQKKLALLMAVMVGLLLIVGIYSDAPSYGAFPDRPLLETEDNTLHSIGLPILEGTPQSPPDGLGVPNVVTGVLWGYRAYDTMGEATVLFTAVVSVSMLGSHAGLLSICKIVGMTAIVKTVASLLTPFLFLFGGYIIFYGHLTPGGGFPGGVIIAAAMVLLLLAYGVRFACSKIGFIPCELGEEIGAIMIVVIGIGGFFTGTYFLQPMLYFGGLGDLLSNVQMILLNIAVGLKVAGGMLIIVYTLISSFGGEV